MADKSDSNESISTHSIPSAACEKKGKSRGPYNQYLSQPQAKIPRTTLKKWPEKKTAINPPLGDDLCSTSSQTRSSTTCSGSFTNNDYTETSTFGLSHSLVHQNAITLERALVQSEELDEFPYPHGDDSDQSFETTSDNCNLVESNVRKTPKVTESEQATIDATEDDQEDIEEYLDAFGTDESAGGAGVGVNADQEENQFEDVPLYEGAPISVAVSMLLIITYAVRHCLTGLALVDLLTLVSLHCAVPNQCASSTALLKKFFMKLKNPIQLHYYCTFCMEYQGLSIPENKLCKNRCCLKDLGKKENSSYFLIIPLMCQLRDLIQSMCSK